MTFPRPFIIVSLVSCLAAAPVTQPSAQPPNGGWTLLFPGTHQIFVSSSMGDDAIGNGSALRPFRSIARGLKVLRSGDDLLLKRGDTFNESFGNGKWQHVTFGAWGTAGDRPMVVADTAHACGALVLNGGDVRFVGLHFVAAHRDPSRPDFKLVTGQFGINCMNCNNILIEDCLIEFFTDGIAIQGSANHGFRLRRSVIRNCYSEGKGFSQGIYLDGQADTLIEETVFDTCGWNPVLEAEFTRRQPQSGGAAASPQGGLTAGATQPTTSPSTGGPQPPAVLPWIATLQPLANQPFPGTPNMFNHGVYDHNDHGAGPSTVRNCIFVNCASSGMTQAVGGTIDNCLFIHNGMAADAWTGGKTGQITNCVCLGSRECPPWAAGGGLDLLSPSGQVLNNIVAHGAAPEKGAALVLWSQKGSPIPIPPDASAVFQGNVAYDWPAEGFYVPTTRSRVDFVGNCLSLTASRIVDIADGSQARYVFNGNCFDPNSGKLYLHEVAVDLAAFHQQLPATQPASDMPMAATFADPSRTIEGYAKSIGLPPTLHDFMNRQSGQNRLSWDTRLTAAAVNDYIRQGFRVVH